MLESIYQARLIKRLEREFPGCYVLKNDSEYQQGIPDLLFLYGTFWAMLEVKPKKPTSPEDYEPNQEWFIEEFGRLSFGACIYPENEEEVIHALSESLGAGR